MKNLQTMADSQLENILENYQIWLKENLETADPIIIKNRFRDYAEIIAEYRKRRNI